MLILSNLVNCVSGCKQNKGVTETITQCSCRALLTGELFMFVFKNSTKMLINIFCMYTCTVNVFKSVHNTCTVHVHQNHQALIAFMKSYRSEYEFH